MVKRHLVYSTGKEQYYKNGMKSYPEISETTVKIVDYLGDRGVSNDMY